MNKHPSINSNVNDSIINVNQRQIKAWVHLYWPNNIVTCCGTEGSTIAATSPAK